MDTPKPKGLENHLGVQNPPAIANDELPLYLERLAVTGDLPALDSNELKGDFDTENTSLDEANNEANLPLLEAVEYSQESEPVSTTGDIPRLVPEEQNAGNTLIDSPRFERPEESPLPHDMDPDFRNYLTHLLPKARDGAIEPTNRLLEALKDYQERNKDKDLGGKVSDEVLEEIKRGTYKKGIEHCVDAAREAIKHELYEDAHRSIKQAQIYIGQNPPLSSEEFDEAIMNIYTVSLEFIFTLAEYHRKHGEILDLMKRLDQAQVYGREADMEKEVKIRTQEVLDNLGEDFKKSAEVRAFLAKTYKSQ